MSFRFKKVMIIEDNDLDRYVLEVLIKNNNIAEEVLEFESGFKALNYIETHKNNQDNLPDIIFLDIYMPLMDGYQFMDLIDKTDIDFGHKCKIYMVSSSIDHNDILKSKQYENIVNYVSKPVTVEFLENI